MTARQKSVFPRCRDSADGVGDTHADGVGDCGDRSGVGWSHGDGDGVGDSVMGMLMATVIVMG